MPGPVRQDLAVALTSEAVAALARIYPAAGPERLTGPADLQAPDAAHPAFHGAFAWPEAAAAQWSLLRLARRFPGDPATAGAAELVAARLTAPRLAVEREFVTARATHAHPYGWAWILALATETAHAGLDPAAVAAVGALAAAVRDVATSWSRSATLPQRSGTRANTAFFLLLALHHAREANDPAFERRLVMTARRWYLGDLAAPTAYEPSLHDVVSPTLAEAHALGVALDSADFSEWFDGFLPGVADVIPPTLRAPPAEPVPDDAVADRRWLTLTRAWNWRGIAHQLPARDQRRVAALDAADRHRTAVDEWRSGDGFAGLVPCVLLATEGL